MCYSYERSVKLTAEMEAEEEAFKENFFICLRAPASKKNDINFDEKTDDDAGM